MATINMAHSNLTRVLSNMNNNWTTSINKWEDYLVKYINGSWDSDDKVDTAKCTTKRSSDDKIDMTEWDNLTQPIKE